MGSISFLELITGPFGTGKTTFLALLAILLALPGKKVLICASSNAAVDAFGGKIESLDPTVKTIRLHSLVTETNRMKSQGISNRRKATVSADCCHWRNLCLEEALRSLDLSQIVDSEPSNGKSYRLDQRGPASWQRFKC